MAVSITSITRVNLAPCGHFRVIADVDGQEVSRVVTLDAISEVGLDEALLRVVKYYVVDRGQGAAGVVGKTILPDVL